MSLKIMMLLLIEKKVGVAVWTYLEPLVVKPECWLLLLTVCVLWPLIKPTPSLPPTPRGKTTRSWNSRGYGKEREKY